MLVYLDGGDQPARRAERELRARGDGALHAGRGPLQRDGTSRRPRARSPAGASTARPATFSSGRALHDDGEKTVLGRTGAFDGDDVLDLLLAQPETAEFVAAQAVARVRLAGARSAARSGASPPRFARSGYEIRAAMRALLLTPTRSGRRRTAARWSSRRSSSSSARCASSTSASAIRCRSWCCCASSARTCSRRRTSRAGRAAKPGSTRSTLLARKQFVERAVRAWTKRACAMHARDARQARRRCKPGARRFMRAMADLQFAGARLARAPFAGTRADDAARAARCCAGRRARSAAQDRAACARSSPIRCTSSNDARPPRLPRRIACGRARSRRVRGVRAAHRPAIAACSCWSSSRAATTASTPSCPTPTALLRAAAAARDRARRRPAARRARRTAPALEPLCRCGRRASSRSCRAWAIRRRTCRISARSRSGTPPRRATSISTTAGSRARSRRARAARIRRRRRRRRRPRHRAARRQRRARDRARPTPSVPAPGAAREPGGRGAQRRARAHPEGRGATSCRPRELDGGTQFRTEFPRGPVRQRGAHRGAARRQPAGVAAVRLSLGGFDTHANQPGDARSGCCGELAEGLVALQARAGGAGPLGHDARATYAEFGRRPKENQSDGTDHGTASVHFSPAAACKGGLYGAAPRLDRLDGGNLPHAVDFRSIYATVLERWWGVPSAGVLRGRFAALDVLTS